MSMVTVEEVALMPAMVPLSKRAPEVKEPVPFQTATLPMVPLPVGMPVVAMLIEPAVEVVMVMLDPAESEPTVQAVPLLIKSWPLLTGTVVMPVPPLLMGRVPETAEEPVPKGMAEL